MFSASWIRYSSSQYRTGTRHGQFGRPGIPPSIRSAQPAGSPLGSCRSGAGSSSQTAALRPLSSSRRSGASRARRRTPEEPRQTPRSGYRPRRTVGPPRRRIRRVGSHSGNLGPPKRTRTIDLNPSAAPLRSSGAPLRGTFTVASDRQSTGRSLNPVVRFRAAVGLRPVGHA